MFLTLPGAPSSREKIDGILKSETIDGNNIMTMIAMRAAFFLPLKLKMNFTRAIAEKPNKINAHGISIIKNLPSL
jgi:hypothetical protein